MRASRRLGAIVAVLLVVAAACGEPEAVPPRGATVASPQATVSPEATAVIATAAPRATAARFPEGLVFSIMGQTDPTFRPDRLVRGYDLIVIGRVIEKLPARWTTPDRLRPADLYSELPHPYTIVTPWVLELGLPNELRALTGPIIPLNSRGATEFPADATRVVVLIEGGKAGKDIVENATVAVQPTVGAQIVIGLHETRGEESDAPSERVLPTEAGPGWWGIAIAGLNDDGSATVYDQSLTANEVVSGILDALARKDAATAVP